MESMKIKRAKINFLMLQMNTDIIKMKNDIIRVKSNQPSIISDMLGIETGIM